MMPARLIGPGLCVAVLSGAVSSFALPDDAGSPARPAAEAAFLADNDGAMSRMMTGMTIKPSGDVDRDFVDMMVPHHQGAIDMAVAVLRYGHNEKIRRLAQEIIVTQQQEIAAMRVAVGEPLPASVASPAIPRSERTPMPRMDMR